MAGFFVIAAHTAAFPANRTLLERRAPPPLAPPSPSSPPTLFDAGDQPLGTAIAVSLVEDHWWHASFPTTLHPLLVSVRVQRASGCSEGAASDGTCTFGLKLFGSHFGPPRADSFEHSYEGAHRAGDQYSLRVPACATRGASGRYHIGLLGWDGTNQLVVRVDEARFRHSQAVCPRVADVEQQPLPVPMPRSSHAAALLGDVMLVFGGQLAEAPADDANEPQSADAVSTPATDELWAFHLPSRTWSAFAKDEDNDELEPVPASEATAVEATAAVEAEETVAEDAAAAAVAARLLAPWPAARSGHSLTGASATVAGAVLLFGGQVSSQSGQGELLNDLWLFNCSGCDKPGAGRGGVWRQLHVTDSNTASPVEGGLTGVPSARVNHAAVAPPSAEDGALVIFGGLGRTRLPDTTVRVAEELESLALRLPLSRLREQSAGRAQQPTAVHGRRSDEAAVAYATAQRELLSDVWRLSLSPPRWERLESRDAVSGAYPARRYGASICACASLAACGTQMPMYLFGGMSRGSGARLSSLRAALRPSDELWAFTPEGGGRWEEVVRRSFGAWPEARAFHTALVRADALLLYGGVNVGGHTLSDVWIFTLPSRAWSLLRAVVDTNAAPFVRRAWHTVVPTDAFSSDALVYGGLEGGLAAQVHADLIRLTPPSCSPASPQAERAAACINCPAGTAALPRPPARANSTATAAASQRATDDSGDDDGDDASRGQCRPCPKGWLSTRPGTGACQPCPRGTFSGAYGLSSWSGCALCPEGTASSRFGASNCTPCAGSTCPAGTIVAGSTAAWPRLHPKWALSELRSDSYPEVSQSQQERELRSSRTQTTITLLGLFGLLGFGAALAAAGLFRPKAAEHLLRHADVPPISGGPGKSRVGGFFTILYVFTYVTLAVELLLQFLFFNYQVAGFLSPTANSHLESTPSTLRVNMRLLGLAPEHCLSSAAFARLLPKGAAAAAASTSYEASALLGARDGAKLEVHGSGCAPGLTLRSGGVEPELGGAPPQLNCSAAPDGASCDVRWECSECSMAGSQIELHLALASRFAMAHAVSWDAAVTWTHRQPAYGRSELRGLLVPTCPGCLLRGDDPSRVQLSLVPTVYANSINATTGRGFRLQYVSSNVGSETAAAAFHEAEPAMHVRFELQPFAQEYDITVTQLQSFLQFVTNLMSLGAGLAFLCRFLLWLYLRVAHTHAMKIGVSAKGMIETQRQRRRSRAGSRYRQGGSSCSDLSATAVEHSDTESQCSIPDSCVVTATASPFGRWFGGHASRGSTSMSSGRLRSRAGGGRGFLGLSRDTHTLGFTKLIEAGCEVDDDREAMHTPPAARGPPPPRNRGTALPSLLPTSPSRGNASADPATRADAADTAQPAAQRASSQESPSDHCARSDGRRRISARALGGVVHHRNHRRNHTWGGNNSSRHVCNLSELRKSLEQGDPALLQGASADAAGARPPVVRKRVASRPSPSAAPTSGYDGTGGDGAACSGALPAFAVPPPLLTPEDGGEPSFECPGTPQASCWYTSPAPESRHEPRFSAAADDDLGHRAKVHRPARASPLSSCNALEALGAAATAAALQKGSVSQPARSPLPLSPPLPSTSLKRPGAIQQGGATDAAAANMSCVGQAARRSLLTHQLGAITVGSTPPRSASHPASPIRGAKGSAERPAPNTPVAPADVGAALIGLTASEEAELRALRQREGVEAIRFIEGCPPSSTPAVSAPATPARGVLPLGACSGPATCAAAALPAAPVASAARAALTAPAVPATLAASAASSAPVGPCAVAAPSAPVTRGADQASQPPAQQQGGVPPPHRNLQLPSLGTARMLEAMVEMSDEASQSSTPGPSSFTDGVTPSSLGCCTPTFACGASAPGLYPPPRTEGFDVPHGGTVGPQRPSSSDSGESPRPHSPSESSVPSSSINAPAGPRD